MTLVWWDPPWAEERSKGGPGVVGAASDDSSGSDQPDLTSSSVLAHITDIPPNEGLVEGALVTLATDAYGPGRSAEMTLYRNGAGAEVFAAGSLNFGGSSLSPVTKALLENLWRRLSR